MVDIRSLPKWKRCLLFFSLLCCFLFVFLLPSSAAINDGEGVSCVAGIPLDIIYDRINKTSGVEDSQLLISNANVYLGRNDFSSYFSGSAGSTNISMNFYANENSGAADVAIVLSDSTDNLSLYGWNIGVPFGLSDNIDYRDFNGIVSCYWNESTSILRDTVSVVYTYFVVTNVSESLTPVTLVYEFNENVPFIFTDTGSVRRYGLKIDQFKIDHVNEIRRLLFNGGHIVDGSIVSHVNVIVDPGHASSIPANYANELYVADNRSYIGSYNAFINRIGVSFYDSIRDRSIPLVSFDGIDWTSWLVNAVGGFMNFEIVPNLTISGIVALLVGMSLFMVFLKVFAGG